LENPWSEEVGCGLVIAGLIADCVAITGVPFFLLFVFFGVGNDPGNTGCAERHHWVLWAGFGALVACGVFMVMALYSLPLEGRLVIHSIAWGVASVVFAIIGVPLLGAALIALAAAVLTLPAVLVSMDEEFINPWIVIASGAVALAAVAWTIWSIKHGTGLCLTGPWHVYD
jgi:hypothetical protein